MHYSCQLTELIDNVVPSIRTLAIYGFCKISTIRVVNKEVSVSLESNSGSSSPVYIITLVGEHRV